MKQYIFLTVFACVLLCGAAQLVFAETDYGYFDGPSLEKTSRGQDQEKKKYFNIQQEPAAGEEEEQEKAESDASPPQKHAEAISQSDDPMRKRQISKAARFHAEAVVENCPGKWEQQGCLRVASDAFLTAAALYAEDVEKSGHKNEIENIKEHCAASTAATRLDDLPAYAMRSAFVECVNEMYDISERTSLKPDLELYQLMVMSVLCLDKDQRCSQMESGLKDTMGKN